MPVPRNNVSRTDGAHQRFCRSPGRAPKERLEAVLEKLKDKTHLDFVVATIKTAGSEDLYDYSLAVANNWKVGAPAGLDRSLLIVIAADNGKFFSQVTRGARIYLPEGLVGEMGQRIREKTADGSYGNALMTGVRAFIDRLGQEHSFDFASLDPQRGENVAQAQRPRTVQSLGKRTGSESAADANRIRNSGDCHA